MAVGRSGTAGMISAPLAQTFERFLADVGGGETFDFLEDMYPEITSQSALTDFMMFAMLGIKGMYGPKGTGLRTVKGLERLERGTQNQAQNQENPCSAQNVILTTPPTPNQGSHCPKHPRN